MKKEERQEKMEKPRPYIAFGAQETVTGIQIEKRKLRMERAEKIGESFTRVTEEECVNPYKIQALAFISEDKPIPEEIIQKMQEFEYGSRNKLNTTTITTG